MGLVQNFRMQNFPKSQHQTQILKRTFLPLRKLPEDKSYMQTVGNFVNFPKSPESLQSESRVKSYAPFSDS